ncbi:MAG TPA: hypothetical protein VK783_00925 [Bacteroidia bacterium]|jgi:hypothetical protein|nr:hypothetical protein [Bacteroidia bacterium]
MEAGNIIFPKVENKDMGIEELKTMPGYKDMSDNELREMHASLKELCLLIFNVQNTQSKE